MLSVDLELMLENCCATVTIGVDWAFERMYFSYIIMYHILYISPDAPLSTYSAYKFYAAAISHYGGAFYSSF